MAHSHRNGIVILSLTAVILLLLNYIGSRPAEAQVAVKDRTYQVVTARIQSGGEALYVTDNRTGMIAVFSYDPASRQVALRAVGHVADAFAGQ